MWVSVSANYEASSDGHIRNKRTGLVLKEFLHKDGYLRTQFDGKTRTVHRVIAKAFTPVVEGKEFVNHIDGNKQNNRADNLEWCTRSENLTHAYAHGLKSCKGERNSRAKLSLEDVHFIRTTYKRGDKTHGAKALSKRFGVAPQTISAVISGQNWRNQP